MIGDGFLQYLQGRGGNLHVKFTEASPAPSGRPTATGPAFCENFGCHPDHPEIRCIVRPGLTWMADITVTAEAVDEQPHRTRLAIAAFRRHAATKGFEMVLWKDPATGVRTYSLFGPSDTNPGRSHGRA